MGSDNQGQSKKQRINNFLGRLRWKQSTSLPAIMILVLIAIFLVYFDTTGRLNISTSKNDQENTVNETTGTAKRDNQAESYKVNESELLSERLSSVIEASKRTPFKAKVLTDGGFKGYWTQSGGNYRFEDPSKVNIIILNSLKQRLWVIDSARKTVIESVLDTSSVSSYTELSPALFIESLSATVSPESKKLEDVLPAGDNSKLTFTNEGLPDRWEGLRKNNTPCFIDWDYIQIGNVPPVEFELPRGLSVTRQ